MNEWIVAVTTLRHKMGKFMGGWTNGWLVGWKDL